MGAQVNASLMAAYNTPADYIRYGVYDLFRKGVNPNAIQSIATNLYNIQNPLFDGNM